MLKKILLCICSVNPYGRCEKAPSLRARAAFGRSNPVFARLIKNCFDSPKRCAGSQRRPTRVIRTFTLLFSILLLYWQLDAHAADLLEVYNQALYSDPKFQQAIAESLVTRDNVPISVSYLLPHLSVFTNPTVSRYGYSGTEYRTGSIGNLNVFDPRNLTQRTYTLDLNITQPVFNFGLYASVAVQLANAKSACATLNAALQDLMIRVSKAYFAILRDEEVITYTIASKRYYQFQLKQVIDQYEAGIKTHTDVYTARAAYESSLAAYIVANKQLANDRENLQAITNIHYSHLSYLRNDFPLISPQPNSMKQWVEIALRQNWSIKAAQYLLEASKQNIRQQFAGHFPTISLQGNFTRYYTNNINKYSSFIDTNGAGTISDKSIGFNVDLPLFEGGNVVSKTNQAKHMYEQQQQVLEENIRNTVNNTSQSFMNIVAGISLIKADKQVINAAVQSLQGTIDRYNSGIETLLDVLNREENLHEAQISYATDRYELVNNILLLKDSAGTLGFDDLRSVNNWLVNDNHIKPFQDELMRQSKTNTLQNLTQAKTNNKRVSLNKNMIQNQADTHLHNLISQIREETRENYQKLENQSQKSNDEIIKLKASLSELKQDLQNKDKQLKLALSQLKKQASRR